MKQEAELRQQTRHVLLHNSIDNLSSSDLKARCEFLTAQIKHAFHINEQITNALTDQYLIIQDRDSKIKTLTDELEYTRCYTLNQLTLFRDDLVSAYETSVEFRPSDNS